MPFIGVPVGLAVGLLLGGKLENLLTQRLRLFPVLFAGIIIRLATEAGLANGADITPLAQTAAMATAYACLSVALAANRDLPGMLPAAVGTLSNGVATTVNLGRMPVWQPSLSAAGFDPATVHSPVHSLLAAPVDLAFLSHAGPLADVVPVALPIGATVVSIGDLLLAAGLAFFAFSAVLRPTAQLSRNPFVGVDALAGPTSVRRHPYARLALNGSFSALWLGQLISALGDRVHQIALVFLVANATGGSPLGVGLAFASATVPLVLVGPVAGTLVDRWNHKETMVVSDLVRAALTVAIPLAATVNVVFVYPLVFALAAASSFFRPARVAALSRVVAEDDLMSANSAVWVADTVSDVAGYPLAGLFVGFLGSSLALAFWIDAASYLMSAALIGGAAIAPNSVIGGASIKSLKADLAKGWAYLLHESVLAATTWQAVVAEYGLGALTALSPLLIAVVATRGLPREAAYGYFEMAIGVGAVLGGLVIGTVAARVRKGLCIVGAFAVFGCALVGLGWIGAVRAELPASLCLGFVVGVANVSFVVPSVTLFQQRTPPDLLGRVVSIRLAAVNLSLATAMITAGMMAQLVGVPGVLALCGAVTVLAALAGFLVPAIRDA